MNFNVAYLLDSLVSGAKYIHISLLLAFVPLVVGIIFGTLIALFRVFKLPFVGKFFAVFVPLYNGVPGIVMLFIYNLLYLVYCSPTPGGVIYVAYFTFCMGHTMRLSETIRGPSCPFRRGSTRSAIPRG